MEYFLRRFLLFAFLAAVAFGSGIAVAEVHLRSEVGRQKTVFSRPLGATLLSQDKNLSFKEEQIPDGEKTTIETAASENSPAGVQFSFAIIGDTQRFEPNTNGNFQKAMTSIRRLNPDLIFVVGDLVGNCGGNNKCERDYDDWKNIVGNDIGKTYAVQGNHDRTGGSEADASWQSVFNFPINGPSGFSELTYSLDFNSSHFVFLDSEKPKEHIVGNEQRDWLERDLANNKKENIFIFFHEPAFPVSSKIGESLDVQSKDRDALWKIFDKYDVTAVFNGHEHITSRRKINSSVFPGAKNDVYQFVFGNTDSFNHDLPAAGVAEYANRGQGRFGIVKVTRKEIIVEVHTADGIILNSFALPS